jgi:hypothetical protein
MVTMGEETAGRIDASEKDKDPFSGPPFLLPALLKETAVIPNELNLSSRRLSEMRDLRGQAGTLLME